MENRGVPIHRLVVRVKSTARGRRRSSTTRRAPLLESLEDRTLLSSGQLDPSFGYQGTLPIIGGPLENIVSDPAGGLIVAGTYAMSRYSADGRLDTTFGSLGTMTVPGGNYILDVAFAPDGKIVVLAGDSIDRFYPNGSIDTTFGTDGSSSVLTVDVAGQPQQLGFPSYLTGDRSLTLLPDGDILVAGSVPVPNVGQVATLMMLSPDGTLDDSFNGNGIVELPSQPSDNFLPTYVVNTVVNEGDLLVLATDGGNNEPGGGTEGLYQYNLDGTLDTNFGLGGMIANPIPVSGGHDDPSLALLPGGSFLVGARYTPQSLISGIEQLYQYSSDGTPDTNFGTDGLVSLAGSYNFGFDNNISVQPNGKVILTAANSTGEPELVRLNPDGSLDATFGSGGSATPITTSGPALATVQPNGRILVATQNGILYGIVGDPVVSFGDATSYSAPSGTPTAEYDVSETAGSAKITLTRGGDLSQPLSVPFSTNDSGGDGGVNYTPVNATVTFAAGSATATVSIPILIDPNASAAVDIPLVLGTPSGGAVLGADPSGVLQIEPTEGIVISVAQISSVAVAGPSSTFTVALQTVPAGNVIVPLSISTTSPAATLSASSLVFTHADALTPQTVTVKAMSNSGAQGSTPAIATVTIGPATSTDPKYNGLAGGTVQVGVYDDGASTPGFIEFGAPNFTVDETASSATITLERLGGSSGSVSVHFATEDGSSEVSGDYTPLSGSISFGPGVTSRTFSIAVTDPGYNLNGDQTVNLTLSNPTGGAQLGVFPTATLTLHDPYAIVAGDLDPAFGDGGAAVLSEAIPSNAPSNVSSTQAVPDVFAVLPDGNVILAGTGTYLSGIQLWEVTQAGQPVASFGQDGLLEVPLPTTPDLKQIAVESNGSIALAGVLPSTGASGSVAQLFLMEFNPDGSIDTSFGNQGEVLGSYSAGDDTLTSVILESDGSLLVGATLDTANDASSTAALIHIEPDGSLDIGFGTGGVLDLPSVPAGFTDMVQQPDGKLLFVVNGSYNGGDYGDGGEVVRLDADDSPDPTFGTNGVAPLSWGEFQFTAIVQPDGKILIGGGGSGQATLGRLNPDGSVDTTFGQGGSVTIGYGNYGSDFNSLILLGDDKIVAVGNAYDPFGSDGGTAEACFLPDGSLDPYFVGGGKWLLNSYPTLESGVALPDGDILIAGGVNSEPVIEAILTSVPASSPAPGQEPGQLAFAASTAAVTAGQTATVTIDRTGGSDGTVTVAYTTQDDTAVAGTDYTTTSGTLTFGPGVTSQTISIPTLVDDGASGSLSLDVVLGTPTGGATVGTADDLSLTITQPTTPPPQQTPTITWANPAGIIYGTPLSSSQLDATANVPGTFSYSPGLGTILHAGDDQMLSVSFTPTDTTDYTAATATSEIDVAQATPLITWADPAAITQGTPLGAAQLDATAAVPGTFVYSPAAGTVLEANPFQPLQVTFQPTDTTDYTSATETVYIDVENSNPSVPTITWANPVGITYGTPLSATQLDATANVPGTFAYSPPLGTVLHTGDNQTLSVTFTPRDTTDYTTATATVEIGVARATPSITWADPAPITQGTPLGAVQLDATASVPGTLVYSPAAGTIPGKGAAQPLTVTFEPTDTTDYTTATDSVFIEVESANRSVPTVTWANPVGITYGTPLSAAQLDATANVPGTFLYSMPSGTVLGAGGNQTLSVTFTPNDTVDYTLASYSVPIDVAQAQAALRFGNLSFAYNGAAQSTTVTTSPVGLAGVFITYSQNGLTVASPTAAGTYQVTASLENPDYTAQSIRGTLTITQPTPAPTPTRTVVVDEQPLFHRKLNKKGKPTGKAVLTGFTLDFGVALNASAANAANYQVDTVTTRKVKRKKETILNPISKFTVSYLPASDAVQLTLGSTETFPTDGQITILGGLTTASGGTLTGPAVFTIAKGGKSVVPA
jgi:uncharacterized delta-60 repeat protein